MGRVAVAGKDKGMMVAVLFVGVLGDGRGDDGSGWGAGWWYTWFLVMKSVFYCSVPTPYWSEVAGS